MAEKKGDENPSSGDGKKSKNVPAEKQPVDKTRLDINIGDLIEPLTGAPIESDAPADADSGESKVAKTLLENDLPTLEKIKELAESGKHSPTAQLADSESHTNEPQLSESGRHLVAKTLLEQDFDLDVDVDSLTPEEFKAYRSRLAKTMPDPRKEPAAKQKAQPAESVEGVVGANASDISNHAAVDSKATSGESVSAIKALAKTIPEPVSAGQNTSDAQQEGVSLKALAKTIPDPQMRERKAVAARIARIRSFQNTMQSKLPIFSKTMTASNFDVLESLRESSSWKTTAATPQQESKSSPPAEKSAPVVEAKAEQAKPEQVTDSSAPLRRKPAAREQFVAKTKLDHAILLQAVSESKHREEARVAALLSEKSKQPPKPPPNYVKADKSASTCPFVWNETDSKEKFRYCTKCQTAIYNFDGLERPEAEALIFSRENREKFTLYGRADGKFMTVDCPLQSRRKKNMLFSLVAGLVLLAGAAAVIMLMPPQPAMDTTQSGQSAESGTGNSDSGYTDSNSDSVTGAPNAVAPSRGPDGMITFSSTSTRKPVDPRKAAPGAGASPGGYQTFKLPSVTDQSAQAPDPDEDGHFWKFE
ncbi:MAG: hypothetical protein U0103_17770 [Candidatus Obscuribacterales bacterium]